VNLQGVHAPWKAALDHGSIVPPIAAAKRIQKPWEAPQEALEKTEVVLNKTYPIP
jgi:hypothetical protein